MTKKPNPFKFIKEKPIPEKLLELVKKVVTEERDVMTLFLALSKDYDRDRLTFIDNLTQYLAINQITEEVFNNIKLYTTFCDSDTALSNIDIIVVMYICTIYSNNYYIGRYDLYTAYTGNKPDMIIAGILTLDDSDDLIYRIVFLKKILKDFSLIDLKFDNSLPAIVVPDRYKLISCIEGGILAGYNTYNVVYKKEEENKDETSF